MSQLSFEVSVLVTKSKLRKALELFITIECLDGVALLVSFVLRSLFICRHIVAVSASVDLGSLLMLSENL